MPFINVISGTIQRACNVTRCDRPKKPATLPQLCINGKTFALYLLKRKGGYGIAIAVPLVLYFFGAIAYAVSMQVPFLSYLTPFTPFYDITADAPFDANLYPFIIYAVIAVGLFIWGINKFNKRDFA